MKPVAILLSLILLIALPAVAFAKTNRVIGAAVEEDDEALRILFKLTASDSVDAEELEVKSKDGLFWVEIPNSYDKQKKRIFYSWKSDKLHGLGLRRLKGKKVAARILFKGKYQPENPSWANAEIVENQLVVTFPKKDPAAVVAVKEAVVSDETEIEPQTQPIDLNAIFETSKADGNKPGTPVASDPSAQKAETKGSRQIPSLSSAAIKFGSALFIVVGIILLSAWVAKRYNLRDRLSGSEPSVVRVVGTAMLGLKKQVAVIDVAGQFWVVGLGPSEITLLGKVDDPNAVASLSKRNSESQKRVVVKTEPEIAPEPVGIPENIPLSEEAKEEHEPLTDEMKESSSFNRLLDLAKREEQEENEELEEMETIRSIKQRLQTLKRL